MSLVTGAAEELPRLRTTEIDGVPVVQADVPGPLRALLMFGVGKTHETLLHNGITHLVEHLAIYALGEQPHFSNGSVRTSITSFDTAGEPADVVRFLDGVSRALRELPVERLESEIRVLETESSRRPSGVASNLLLWRYGPNGPGLWAYDELAVRTVDGASLQRWADTMFTRENAVLVLSGAAPEGLSLDLASGHRQQVPALTDVLPGFPAWFEHQASDTAALGHLPRSVESMAYCYALRTRLVDVLRRQLGVAYSPAVEYDPYDATTALLWVTADSHPDHVVSVAQTVLSTVLGLAQDGVPEDAVDAFRTLSRQARATPEYALSLAYGTALDILLGRETEPPEVQVARVESLTTSAVSDIAAAAPATLLYGAPRGAALDPWVLRAPTTSLDAAVTGPQHYSLVPGSGSVLVRSRAGVSIVNGSHASTVRFDRVRAALAWPDGRRTLFSSDGLTLVVEPRLWNRGDEIVAAIDLATEFVRVTMPARDPAEFPRKASWTRRLRRYVGTPRVLGSVVVAGAGLLSLVLGIVEGRAPGGYDRPGNLVLLGFGLMGGAAIRLLRR